MKSAPPSSFQSQLAAALDHLNRGDLDAASAACAALRRAGGENPATLQLEATIALRAGRAAAALDSIRRALTLRPGHVPSLLLAARAARAAGRANEAVAPLREAIRLAPDAAEPVFLLCQTLLELNEPSLEAAVTEAAARHPGHAAQWQQLGQMLQRAGRAALALIAFDQAAADPALAEAQFGRGLALRDLGRMAPARAALRRAVELAPGSGGAWFALGLTCQDLADEAEAAEAFAAALAAHPTLAEAAVNLGIARQRLGDMDGAIAAYRQAVAIRADTFGRIAQAVCAARTGFLCLNPAALRRLLGA